MQNLDSITTTTVRPPVRTDNGSRELAPKHYLWSRDEYYRIAGLGVFEGKRVELIEGEIIEMAPMGTDHAGSSSVLTDVLMGIFGKGYFIRGQMPLDIDERSQPEPDIAVVKGSPRDSFAGHPKTLVLAVEISNSSLSLDRDVKPRLYAKAGIEDYWVVNLQDRCVEVYRKPTDDPNLGFIYAERTVFGEDQSFSPLAKPKSKIKVADILP